MAEEANMLVKPQLKAKLLKFLSVLVAMNITPNNPELRTDPLI